MESIKKILNAKGVQNPENMEFNESYTVENEGYHDLTVEKIDSDLISVAHYYTQRMDLMRDPEIVFRMEDNGNWTPIEYTQDDMGLYKRDLSGLGMDSFVKRWDENLETQGFVEAAD